MAKGYQKLTATVGNVNNEEAEDLFDGAEPDDDEEIYDVEKFFGGEADEEKDFFIRGRITHKTTMADEYKTLELVTILANLLRIELKRFDLKFHEYYALAGASRFPGINIGRLAQRLSLYSRKAERTIKILKDKGFIEVNNRQRNSGDSLEKDKKVFGKYRTEIHLTPKGVMTIRRLTERLDMIFDGYTIRDKGNINFLLNHAIENVISLS